MSNILIGLKKFISNKNVVTVIGVFLIIGIIYFGYSTTINKATSPMTVVVAKDNIPANTRITADMVKTISVPAAAISSNVLAGKGAVVGKYTSPNSIVPKGSMFYKGVVVSAEERSDYKLSKLNEGEVLTSLDVNMKTTYGNSIINDSYIDIYMKAIDDNGELMIGKFLENVKVISVESSNGLDVNSDPDNRLSPSVLYFSASRDVFSLIEKAKRLSSRSVELFPVLHGTVVSEEELNLKVSTQFLRDFIDAHTVTIDETPVDDTTTTQAAEETDVKSN